MMSEEEEQQRTRRVRTPTPDQRWVYVILGIKEPLGLPPKKLT
jgi:hypothetical protein